MLHVTMYRCAVYRSQLIIYDTLAWHGMAIHVCGRYSLKYYYVIEEPSETDCHS